MNDKNAVEPTPKKCDSGESCPDCSCKKADSPPPETLSIKAIILVLVLIIAFAAAVNFLINR